MTNQLARALYVACRDRDEAYDKGFTAALGKACDAVSALPSYEDPDAHRPMPGDVPMIVRDDALAAIVALRGGE